MVVAANAELTLLAIAAAHHGVLTSGLALGEGVTTKALRHQAAMGRLLRVKHGIYRVRGHPVTWESRLQAALFDAGPAAVVAGRSAGRRRDVHRDG
jgi:hypothetical protein